MTKAQVRKFVGKRVEITWRDPTSDAGWTGKPLADESSLADTLGIIQGFNARGELVIAGSQIRGGDVGDRTTLPLSCVEDIRELQFKLRRYRR